MEKQKELTKSHWSHEATQTIILLFPTIALYIDVYFIIMISGKQ